MGHLAGELRTFEGFEKSVSDLKLLFLKTLLEWINASGCFLLVLYLRCLIVVLFLFDVGVPVDVGLILCDLQLKRLMESDAEMTEEIAYNIIPLDGHTLTNAIVHMLEVSLLPFM